MRPEAFFLLDALLAAGLSALIGMEREYFKKPAGIRTHTLVGLGAAVFTIVSKYGFWDVVRLTGGTTDGARVAAQVVTGIGFLGAGLIFVRRDSVHGLTTAASIWLTAAVGMTAGAGLPIIAVGVTAIYFVVTLGARPLSRHMPHAASTSRGVTISYDDGRGVLREVMETIGSHGVVVSDTEVVATDRARREKGQRTVIVHVLGSTAKLEDLVADLDRIDGVRNIETSAWDETEN